MERTPETRTPVERERTSPDGNQLEIARRRLLKAGIAAGSIAAAAGVPGTATARSTNWDDLTLHEQLKVVRKATQSYERLDKMGEAGYGSFLPLICGLGLVFDNLENWETPLDPEHPESLFYVLNDGGKLKLAGVELILVTERDEDGNPIHPRPDLFNDEDEPLEGDPLRGTSEEDGWLLVDDPASGMTLWVLHIWVHERNPNGVFNPRNPRYADMPGCGSLA